MLKKFAFKSTTTIKLITIAHVFIPRAYRSLKLCITVSWFDTVMQSFSELYARGMKTWAIVISFIVVVLLNANFFNIYQKISTNEALRNSLVQGQARPKELQQTTDSAA